ncbi:hypothetical protein PGTUg99_011570 [Puccinia graminis f. sp. tritici]|uniref:Uncharacterized protein n=1 Tax=Puccinia graminis f. sp. tritici TaxID=56615 RepID=A0A5B0SI34_PUCGR|nr:hypothetical protein PGTUg99_011570 [Puccinia graminis f. sp. tritici]
MSPRLKLWRLRSGSQSFRVSPFGRGYSPSGTTYRGARLAIRGYVCSRVGLSQVPQRSQESAQLRPEYIPIYPICQQRIISQSTSADVYPNLKPRGKSQQLST